MEQNMAIYDNVDSAENNMPQSGDLSSDIQRKANESPSNSEGLFTSNINIDATSSESPYQKTSKNHSNNFKEVNDRNLVESCENEIDLESKFPANSNNHKNIQPSENGESESTKVDNFATDRLSDSKQNDDSNTDVDTIYYSVVSTYEEPENNIILPDSLIEQNQTISEGQTCTKNISDVDIKRSLTDETNDSTIPANSVEIESQSPFSEVPTCTKDISDDDIKRSLTDETNDSTLPANCDEVEFQYDSQSDFNKNTDTIVSEKISTLSQISHEKDNKPTNETHFSRNEKNSTH